MTHTTNSLDRREGASESDAPTAQRRGENGPDKRRSEHDRLMGELGRHAPEGEDVSSRARRMELRVMLPLLAGSILGAVAFMYLVAGWLGVALGSVLFGLYYAIGWSPEILAAIQRRAEHERFEHIVEQTMEQGSERHESTDA